MCGPKLPSTDRNCRSSSRNAVPMRSIWKNAAERKKATFHENGNYYCRNEVPGMGNPTGVVQCGAALLCSLRLSAVTPLGCKSDKTKSPTPESVAIVLGLQIWSWRGRGWRDLYCCQPLGSQTMGLDCLTAQRLSPSNAPRGLGMIVPVAR